MEHDNYMTTLSEVLEKLKNRGITKAITMNKAKEFVRQDSEKVYHNPSDLQIIRTFRFEGDSNPSDNVALYIIKDKDNDFSFIIEAYGADSNYDGPEYDTFLKAIVVNEDEHFTLH